MCTLCHNFKTHTQIDQVKKGRVRRCTQKQPAIFSGHPYRVASHRLASLSAAAAQRKHNPRIVFLAERLKTKTLLLMYSTQLYFIFFHIEYICLYICCSDTCVRHAKKKPTSLYQVCVFVMLLYIWWCLGGGGPHDLYPSTRYIYATRYLSNCLQIYIYIWWFIYMLVLMSFSIFWIFLFATNIRWCANNTHTHPQRVFNQKPLWWTEYSSVRGACDGRKSCLCILLAYVLTCSQGTAYLHIQILFLHMCDVPGRPQFICAIHLKL